MSTVEHAGIVETHCSRMTQRDGPSFGGAGR